MAQWNMAAFLMTTRQITNKLIQAADLRSAGFRVCVGLLKRSSYKPLEDVNLNWLLNDKHNPHSPVDSWLAGRTQPKPSLFSFLGYLRAYDTHACPEAGSQKGASIRGFTKQTKAAEKDQDPEAFIPNLIDRFIRLQWIPF